MHAVFRPLRSTTPVHFFWFTVLSIVVTRALIIAATPQYGALIDLSIYREAGQLVVNGIDPYDLEADSSLREQFRLDGRGADAYVSHSQARYDHFVSSNLPASTLLFALFEWISGGNPLGWRAALVLGDLLMALGAYMFCVRAGVDLQRLENRLGFLTLLVAYPSLAMWGTVVPEDKQFQTGLMLLLAALLLPVPRGASGATHAAALGASFALSILFKAMGAIFFPALALQLLRRPRRELAWFGLTFVAVSLVLVAPFSASFVPLMAKRLHSGSVEAAHHASPWTLLPWPDATTYLRPAAVLLTLALLGSAYLAKKIDLLNALAALLVSFICIWITNGSMDRLNISMIVACFCLATASPDRWWKLALANATFQTLTYGAMIVLHGANSDAIERGDAANTAFFLLTYFAIVMRPGSKLAPQTPSAAIETRRASAAHAEV